MFGIGACQAAIMMEDICLLYDVSCSVTQVCVQYQSYRDFFPKLLLKMAALFWILFQAMQVLVNFLCSLNKLRLDLFYIGYIYQIHRI